MGAADTPAVDVRGLTRHFGHHQALRGIDLRVEPEQCLAIFGPNGAGKTTLIKILATIMRPSAGSVTVGGLDLKGNAQDIRRRIGVVTHQTFLYGNLTVRENLDFYARLYDVPSRRERIQEVVARVGMTHRLHDRVSTLSRGMQQRISIARAVLHRPDIMLLDEPEAGLDQEAVSLLWRILREEEGRRTILLITHSLERGLELCDRLVILHSGRIVYESAGQALDLPGLREAYSLHTGLGAS
jgi:ABC-type multidrug transport system ATPase subunit